MRFSLKLVGNNHDLLININKNSINIFDVFNYLMKKGLSFDEISKIMFVNKGKNITDDTETLYTNTEDDPLIIHMFTQCANVKDEIIKCVYSSYQQETSNNKETEDELDESKSEDESEDKSDDESEDNNNEVSQEEINKNNLKTVELFLDKDFTYLLKVCLNKPELLNKVSNYITNGNISFEIKEINKEDFKYQKEYTELIELLNKLDIDPKGHINIINNEILVMSVLQHFEGNINLSLRYIINLNNQ
jgi:hypothetical protein